MIDIKDRAIGCFIGLAVGDAIGTTNEFKEPGEFTPLTDMVGGGVFRLQPGEWTDDTSMALCLADSIIAHDKIEPTDLMHRFLRWYNNGENSSNGKCFDIGSTVSEALDRFEDDFTFRPAPDLHFLSGNGSIMRLAPIAVRWYNDVDVSTYAVLQGGTTHGSQACWKACATLSTILSVLINGDEPTMPDYRNLLEDDIPNSGFVDHTMIAAIWAYQTTDNFRDCILKAANLGGDADTIAAVAGQIAGAKYGLSNIPIEWVDRLAKKDHLLDIATKLYNMSIA